MIGSTPAGTFGVSTAGSIVVSGSSSGGGTAALLPAMSFGRSGGKVVEAGDSIMLGNGGTEYSIGKPIEAKANEAFRLAGMAPLTYVNIATGGNTSSDIWFTGLANIKAQLGADGQDLLVNGTINDILGLIGNDLRGPWTQAQTISNIRTGISAATGGVLATYPNTRIWLIGPMWGTASETYTISSSGQPQGNGTSDRAIRNMDSALASLARSFPKNVRYLSLYNFVYRAALACNPTNINSVLTQSGGPHPSGLGVRVIGDAMLSQMIMTGSESPSTVLPVTRQDQTTGDWVREWSGYIDRHLQTSTSGSMGSTWNGTLNRMHVLPIAGVPPTGFTDASRLGGAWRFSGAGTGLLTPLWLPNPAVAWAIAMRVTFSAIAAGDQCFVGLMGANASNLGYLIGIDGTTSATKWSKWENNGGATVKTASALNATVATPVTLVLCHQPSDLGNNIIDVTVDAGTGLAQMFHVNPSGQYPTSPVGLGAALCLNSVTVDIGDALYKWFE